MSGKWQARVVIPTGGWSFDVTETGGGGASDTVSLTAAETYYHSTAGSGANDLPAQIAAALNAATLNATYTCSISNSTGKYTITASGGSVTAIAITWTSTDLRDLLGWTGNLSAALTYTSPNQAKGLWLPDSPVDTPMHLTSDGMRVADRSSTLAPDGTYYSVVYSSYYRNNYSYTACTQERVIAAAESTTNASLQTFWDDAVFGDAAWAKPGKAVRWHADATVDGTYKTLNILGGPEYPFVRNGANPQWDGLWDVSIDVAKDV